MVEYHNLNLDVFLMSGIKFCKVNFDLKGRQSHNDVILIVSEYYVHIFMWCLCLSLRSNMLIDESIFFWLGAVCSNDAIIFYLSG